MRVASLGKKLCRETGKSFHFLKVENTQYAYNFHIFHCKCYRKLENFQKKQNLKATLIHGVDPLNNFDLQSV